MKPLDRRVPNNLGNGSNSFAHLKQFVDLLKFNRVQFTRFPLKLFHMTWIIRLRIERSAVSRVIVRIRFRSGRGA